MASSPVHKTQIVPFVNTSTTEGTYEWVQIKKSTTFSLALNPQTKTYDFISSKVAQTEVDSYQPALDQEITMFKGEEDYELFFDMVYNLPTGSDAHRDFLLAWYQQEGTDSSAATCYKAWLVDSTVQVNTLDSVNSSISVSLSLTEPTIGAVYVTDGVPSFTEGTWSDDVFTAA